MMSEIHAPKLEDVSRRWSARRVDIREATLDIIVRYEAAGTPLGVRQVCYRLEGQGIIEKSDQTFKMVGEWLVELRKRGVLPFDSFEDRTRTTQLYDADYVSPETVWGRIRRSVEQAPDYYRLPRWYGQPAHVEVWCGARGVASSLAQLCEDRGVALKPLGGQDSITEQWASLLRLQLMADGQHAIGDLLRKDVHVLYVGDHDPSGFAIQDRAYDNMADNEWTINTGGGWALVDQSVEGIEFNRVAVTLDLVLPLGLAANPTPVNPRDSNTPAYLHRFGTSLTWEADANDQLWSSDAADVRDELEDDERAKIATWSARFLDTEEE